MTRKTAGSGWTAKWIIPVATLALAGVFALGVVLSPPRYPAVEVVGDRANELNRALGTGRGEEATVTVAMINRWENLRHLPDIAEKCWDACHNRVSGQITLTRMRFGATHKTVVFHLPSFEGDLECVAERARAEVIALRAADPSCHAEITRHAVWILPMGLGRL